MLTPDAESHKECPRDGNSGKHRDQNADEKHEGKTLYDRRRSKIVKNDCRDDGREI